MVFATSQPCPFAMCDGCLEGEEWKGLPPFELWCRCSQCLCEFIGRGCATEDAAIALAIKGGWRVWQPFAGCEAIDPAYGRELLCRRCAPEFLE